MAVFRHWDYTKAEMTYTVSWIEEGKGCLIYSVINALRSAGLNLAMRARPAISDHLGCLTSTLYTLLLSNLHFFALPTGKVFPHKADIASLLC